MFAVVERRFGGSGGSGGGCDARICTCYGRRIGVR